MAENNLEQLWAEENEQEKTKRMDDLAEVNDDSEEYIEDDNNPDKDTKQLGAIGSSKPKKEDNDTETETEAENNEAVAVVRTPSRSEASKECCQNNFYL